MKAVTENGQEYDSWDELVEEESNGYVAVAILRSRTPAHQLFPMVLGPFTTKREAENARKRIRANYRRRDREERVYSDLMGVHVKPAWKDLR